MTNKLKFSVRHALVVGTLSAFLLASIPLPTAAQTSTSALEAQIAALVAKIEALTSQLNQPVNQPGNSAAGMCPYTWTRDLKVGASGPDVKKLQQFLNSDPTTQISVSGVGSPGLETEYFGPLTAAAVSKFQVKYRSEILTPVGLSSGTGYFGPSTRAKANLLCVTKLNTPPVVSEPKPKPTPTTPAQPTLRGDVGTIKNAEFISRLNNEEVGEGQKNVEIAGLEIEPEGSDIQLMAVRLKFSQLTADQRFNKYADEVSLWLDDDRIAKLNASEFTRQNDYTRTISLSGNPTIDEGDVAKLIVAISAQRNIDSADEGETWEVAFESIRFKDAEGAVITDSSTDDIGSETTVFSFESFASAANLQLRVRDGEEKINDARTIQVSETDRSNDIKLFSFEIEARGKSDLVVDDLTIDFSSTGAGVGEIINRARLMVNGEVIGSESIASSVTTSQTVTFDNLDYLIEAEDTITVTLSVDANRLTGNFTAGATLLAATNPDDWQVEDENGDDLATTDLHGSAASEAHSFLASGVMVKLIGSTASPAYNVGNTSADDQGVYTMEIEISAFEDTAWLQLKAGRSTDAVTDSLGLAYSIVDASTNTVVGTGTSTATVARLSGGSVTGNFVRLNDGQTARVKLQVYYDADTSGVYRIQLNEIGFNQSSAAPASEAQVAVPAENFESNSVQVLN